jgi:propionyl-CoA synthetase
MCPDASAWWRLVQKYQVNLMLSSATAMRLLRRGGRRRLPRCRPGLAALPVPGREPLDEPTAAWLEEALGKPVIDHYWQTETGSPVIGLPLTDLDGCTLAAPARLTGHGDGGVPSGAAR